MNLHSNRQKQVLALSLSVALTIGTGLSAMAAYFSDIQSYWGSQAIQRLSDERVIGGYPDGTFRPEGNITRAEFASILVNALNLQNRGAGYSSFRDVPSSFWGSPAIEAVKAQGLVSGYPDGTFLPSKNISRAEALATLANASRMTLPDEVTANQILSNYSDQTTIPTWARRGVAATIQAGIFANDPYSQSRVEALQPATRGEVAAMVQNLRERLNLAGTPAGSASSQTATNTNNTQNNNQQTSTNTGAYQARVTALPTNTKFAGTLTNPVSTEANRVGDRVSLTIDQPLVSSDNIVVIPAGSQINGSITTLEPAGRVGKNAKMGITFNEIVTPDNRRFTIAATVDTEDGMLHGGTSKGRVLKALGKTALGAGLGAALGTAMGPLSGGSVGKGAIYGTAIGAGAGAVAAGVSKGEDVVVTTGDKIEVKLTQPVSVTTSTGQQVQ